MLWTTHAIHELSSALQKSMPHIPFSTLTIADLRLSAQEEARRQQREARRRRRSDRAKLRRHLPAPGLASSSLLRLGTTFGQNPRAAGGLVSPPRKPSSAMAQDDDQDARSSSAGSSSSSSDDDEDQYNGSSIRSGNMFAGQGSDQVLESTPQMDLALDLMYRAIDVARGSGVGAAERVMRYQRKRDNSSGGAAPSWLRNRKSVRSGTGTSWPVSPSGASHCGAAARMGAGAHLVSRLDAMELEAAVDVDV